MISTSQLLCVVCFVCVCRVCVCRACVWCAVCCVVCCVCCVCVVLCDVCVPIFLFSKAQFNPFAAGFEAVIGSSVMLKQMITAPQLQSILCSTEAKVTLSFAVK